VLDYVAVCTFLAGCRRYGFFKHFQQRTLMGFRDIDSARSCRRWSSVFAARDSRIADKGVTLNDRKSDQRIHQWLWTAEYTLRVALSYVTLAHQGETNAQPQWK
jgi:hypothetical protein